MTKFAIMLLLSFLCQFNQASLAEDLSPAIIFDQNKQLAGTLPCPFFEWYPQSVEPKALVLAIHGMTLHATSYDLVGKSFALAGLYMAAADMRGFGSCRRDDHRLCAPDQCMRGVDYEGSYRDIVAVARWMRERYPTVPLIAMGESLGATLAIRLVAEHPELTDGMILSGPAIKINPLMYFHPASIRAGLKGFFANPHFRVDLSPFIRHLVSDDPQVSQEMLDDPLVAKNLTIRDLIISNAFVGKTLHYASGVAHNTPVLILQGGHDRCVIARCVVKLTKRISSSDQTLRWLGHHGHLLLETYYVRAATLDALVDWLRDHLPGRIAQLREIEQKIKLLGGKATERD